MTARRFLTVSALSLSIVGALPATLAFAQQAAGEMAVPAVDNSKFNFVGEVNANALNVRSGPGDNYYPTKKLAKGDRVTVVGIKYDWLKITPPEGSFCYVAKAFVSQKEDGSVGVVDKNDLNVRAGSDLTDAKYTVQTKLDAGTEVKILGEKEEYFKIAPPKGVFLYVNKEFISAVEQLAENNPSVTEAAAAAAENEGPVVSEPVKPQAETAAHPDVDAQGAEEGVVATQTPTAAAPTTQQVEKSAEAPSTQPAATPSATARFDKIEADFLTFTKVKIEEQPLDAAIEEYTSLAGDNKLPESMRRVAQARLETLKVRKEALTHLTAVRDMERQMVERNQALASEQQELNERIKQHAVTFYTAVGTLRPSSLQTGPKTLYRLTDPANGKTVVYINSDDTKLARMIGQFIGVKGTITEDTAKRLKYITPTDVAAVETSALNSGNVVAEIMPPSILATSGTASTGNQ